MKLLLEGKTAVVTGCNRGIGKAILDVFANNGANIWACTRQPDDKFSEYVTSLSKKTGVEINQVTLNEIRKLLKKKKIKVNI